MSFKDTKDKLSDSVFAPFILWFIENHVAANILAFLCIVGGIVGISNMPREVFPRLDPRLINITVQYNGANPDEIARTITMPIERELIGIDGVKDVFSLAAEGLAYINVEVEEFVDVGRVYDDVERNVNSMVDSLPENAKEPLITRSRSTYDLVTLALYGDYDDKVLKYWAEIVKDQLLDLDGVNLVEIRGIASKEIWVELNEHNIRKYNLTFDEVTKSIKSYFSDIPIGSIESSSGDISLRMKNTDYSLDNFANVPVRHELNGAVLYLGDIAKIFETFDRVKISSKFSGKNTAFIHVRRSGDDDTLSVAKIVKDNLHNITLPGGIKLTIKDDDTENLVDRISLMMRNGVLGFVCVFLILLLFLDLKLAFWIAAAIPISFLGGMMLMYFTGQTINMITLFALIVVLGIVVDDSIVVGESVFAAQERLKKTVKPSIAVLHGVSEVIAPVTVGVLTTMSAFLPLMFSTGNLGQIIAVIPVVIIAILFVSLVEAFLILPAHLSGYVRWSKGVLVVLRNKTNDFLERLLESFLLPLVSLVLSRRYISFLVFLTILFSSFIIVKTGILRFTFFPSIESNKVGITLYMPVGSSFDQTKSMVNKIEDNINILFSELEEENRKFFNSSSRKKINKHISVDIGQVISSGGPGGRGISETGTNVARINVMLVPSDLRIFSAKEIEYKIKERIDYLLPEVDKIEYQSSLMHDVPDIDVALAHKDQKKLYEASEYLKSELSKISGVENVNDTNDRGKLEYDLSINNKAIALGLDNAQLGMQLRSRYFGDEAMIFQQNGEETKLYVRYDSVQRNNPRSLNQMRINLNDERTILFSNVTNLKQTRGYNKIYTNNGKQIISVVCDVNQNINTTNDVMKDLELVILPKLKNIYTGVEYSFQGQAKDQKSDMASLGSNMLVALTIIYVLLGMHLRSYVQPIIIMIIIPFGIAGAILGHLLLGYSLTFISLFGMVALTGVVVNDSVLLIDYFNKQLLNGLSYSDALLSAVKRRFRSVLLTSLSTSIGLMPILLETSLQAKFLIPMVVSLSTGIIFATFIIVLLLPCIVAIVIDIKNFLNFYFLKYFSQ